MSTKKSNEDITRIEDLGEYLHELNEEESEESFSFEEEPPSFEEETPSFEEEPPSFEEETPSFEEETPSFEEETPSFEEETPSFEEETPSFEEETPSFEEETPSFEEETPSFETISQIQKFSESQSFATYGVEGNPPFSIIIKDIHYIEDLSLIVEELNHFKVLKPEDNDRALESLKRGSYLISRISEYQAILLCHKLRRFNVTTQMGLSSEIHPSSADKYSIPAISKYSVYQNKKEHLNFEKEKELSSKDILVSTTHTLEGHHILKYIEILTESLLVSEDALHSFSLSEELKNNISDMKKRENALYKSIKDMNHESSSSELFKEEIFSKEEGRTFHEESPVLEDYYSTLIEKLKVKALAKGANGVIGINFIITPLPHNEVQYQISATGNAVWLKPH